MDPTSVSLVGTLPGIPAVQPSVSATSVSPVAPSSASAASSSSSGSTALFIAEIPLEVTEAEFRSTFSSEPGYVSARLRRDRNENTVGFVEFSDHKSAAEAREQFNNFKFSHNDDHGITIHFAHEHSRNKHRERDDGKHSYGSQHYDQPTSSRKGYNNGGYRHDGYGSMRAADVNSRVSLTSGLPLVPMGVSPMMPGPTSLDMSGMQFYSTVAPNAQFASYQVQPQAYSPQLSPDAAPTLYVEGLPLDATEREVAHIFRQMPGYLGIRIKPKESKQHPSRVFNLCWVEFETKYNAAVALHHLKGYKMDKNDTKGLTISYAKTTRKERRGPSVHGLNGMPLDKSL